MGCLCRAASHGHGPEDAHAGDVPRRSRGLRLGQRSNDQESPATSCGLPVHSRERACAASTNRAVPCHWSYPRLLASAAALLLVLAGGSLDRRGYHYGCTHRGADHDVVSRPLSLAASVFPGSADTPPLRVARSDRDPSVPAVPDPRLARPALLH